MSTEQANKIPRYFAVDSMGRIHIHDEVEQLKGGAPDVVLDFSQIWVSSFFEEYGDINDWNPVFEIEYEDSGITVRDWSDPVDGVVLRCEKIGERNEESGVELLRVTLVKDPDANLNAVVKVGYKNEPPGSKKRYSSSN